jgi:hypothetical protein
MQAMARAPAFAGPAPDVTFRQLSVIAREQQGYVRTE